VALAPVRSGVSFWLLAKEDLVSGHPARFRLQLFSSGKTCCSLLLAAQKKISRLLPPSSLHLPSPCSHHFIQIRMPSSNAASMGSSSTGGTESKHTPSKPLLQQSPNDVSGGPASPWADDDDSHSPRSPAAHPENRLLRAWGTPLLFTGDPQAVCVGCFCPWLVYADTAAIRGPDSEAAW
jgi:hypothetical protein